MRDYLWPNASATLITDVEDLASVMLKLAIVAEDDHPMEDVSIILKQHGTGITLRKVSRHVSDPGGPIRIRMSDMLESAMVSLDDINSGGIRDYMTNRSLSSCGACLTSLAYRFTGLTLLMTATLHNTKPWSMALDTVVEVSNLALALLFPAKVVQLVFLSCSSV